MSGTGDSVDRRGPIVIEAERTAWVAPAPDDQKPIAKDTKLCVYCGRYHGSENKAFRCLEDGVRALRAELERVQAEHKQQILSLKTVARLDRAGREPAPKDSEPASAEPADRSADGPVGTDGANEDPKR
jgi:hypothetical protein